MPCKIAEEALAYIARRNPAIKMFIAGQRRDALEEAAAIDRCEKMAGRCRARGPYAVQGSVRRRRPGRRLQGSALNRRRLREARRRLVARMREAGAVLVGTLNMDAYALRLYHWRTAHFGRRATRTIHARCRRITGGYGRGGGRRLRGRVGARNPTAPFACRLRWRAYRD